MPQQTPVQIQRILAAFHSQDERAIREAAFEERRSRFRRSIQDQCDAWVELADAGVPLAAREAMIARTIESLSVPFLYLQPPDPNEGDFDD